MPTFSELLKSAPIITDGAWGTQLQQRGLAFGECPDKWNLDHPDRVEAVARSYVEAGSQIILTNTFGANRVRLQEFGLEEKAHEINRAGAELSKRAANDRALVFASIGPCGKMLMAEEVTEGELRAAFEEQSQALAEGGADGLVIETMSDLDEAQIALAAAKQTGLPVVACMVYDTGAEKDRTMMGVTPEQQTIVLSSAGADVIGANCGNGIDGYIAVCQRLHAATRLPIWIKANAGLPEIVDGRAEYRTSPEVFASHVPQLIDAGATFIGGCCGTTPEHISALKSTFASKP